MRSLPGFLALVLICRTPAVLNAQHHYEFNNQGAEIYVTSGAEIYVWGDVHMEDATALWDHDGLMEVQGNMYSDNLFQQRGTGTVRIENNDVNIGERQFIEGSYAVRGGSGSVGVDDGSFYILELANTQGAVHLLGSGNVADVRYRVDFEPAGASGSPPVNRIVTHDTASVPANGSLYSAVFGIMNPSPGAHGLGTLLHNTVTDQGYLSSVDAGYIQGKFRRAIDPAGGLYGFVMGLEPGGSSDARGVQYVRLYFYANTYDVLTGYFEQGSDNTVPGIVGECVVYYILYYMGNVHGEWMFSDLSGSGAGSYYVQAWPQDAAYTPQTVWLITQDDTIRGTANECGPSAAGLIRSGFNGFESPSQFGIAGADAILEPPLVALAGSVLPDGLGLRWSHPAEQQVLRYRLERAAPGGAFRPIHETAARANDGAPQAYAYSDSAALPGIAWQYRVLTLHADGSVRASNLLELFRPETGWAVQAVPNPHQGGPLTLILQGPAVPWLRAEAYDLAGRRCWSRTFEQPGSAIELPEDLLPEGLWLLRVHSSLGVRTLRVLEQR